MKKILVGALAILVLGTFAFAQNQGIGGNNPCNCPIGDNGYGMMGGMDKHYFKKGKMHDNGYNQQNITPTVNTVEEAKAKVQEVINTSFKGYKIVNAEEFNTPKGFKAYNVTTTDAGGNQFQFHVNQFGNVKGPWINIQAK